MRQQYRADVNKHLEVFDWRDQKWRQEKFIWHLKWRYWANDLDDVHWNTMFMESSHSPTGKPMTKDQKIWFSFLYGITYQPCLAWTIFWHFPDPANLDLKALQEWDWATVPKQIWRNEVRYNRYHLAEFAQRFLDWCDGKTPWERANSFVEGGKDKYDAFEGLYESVLAMKRVGRFQAWTMTQCMVESAGIKAEPKTMYIASDAALNQWLGLVCYDNKPEFMTKKNYGSFMADVPRVHIDENVRNWMEKRSFEIKEELNQKCPEVPLTMLNLESMFCEWSGDMSHMYPGDHAMKVMGTYPKFRISFPEVDFTAFKDAIDMVPSQIKWMEPVFPKNKFLIDTTGQIPFLNEIMEQAPDVLAELQIDPSYIRMREENGDYVINGDRDKRKAFVEKKFDEYSAWFNSTSYELFS